MKMKPEHYETLKAAVLTGLARQQARGEMTLESYKARGLSAMRFNFDVLYLYTFPEGVNASRWVSDNLYSYLNDEHIGTALKQILGNDGLSARHTRASLAAIQPSTPY